VQSQHAGVNSPRPRTPDGNSRVHLLTIPRQVVDHGPSLPSILERLRRKIALCLSSVEGPFTPADWHRRIPVPRGWTRDESPPGLSASLLLRLKVTMTPGMISSSRYWRHGFQTHRTDRPADSSASGA
jgi:hypothetical protein